MYEVSRDGSIIHFTIQVIDHTITTSFNCGSTLYAKLLYERLLHERSQEIEKFARKLYNEGYNDKTKRKPRRDWFPGNMKNY